MENIKIISAGSTDASRYAADYLAGLGLSISLTPSPEATHLLLDVPSFQKNGSLRGGASLEELLRQLPGNITVCGGNLNHPALAEYETIDFLRDETYLCENAWITAECALDVALPYLNRTLRRCPVLIIGWGRIGKCLAAMLKSMEADITVAARKKNDRAMLLALGYGAISTEAIAAAPYRVIFNTAPQMVLPHTPAGALKIDLASQPGIGGEDVIWARGLPGKDAPEESGALIAKTALRYALGKEISV